MPKKDVPEIPAFRDFDEFLNAIGLFDVFKCNMPQGNVNGK